MANNHHSHVFHTLEEYVEYKTTYSNTQEPFEEGPYKEKVIRKVHAQWKRHIEKHGNVPMIIRCSICSGQEYKKDLKHGRFKPHRPNKNERDENKI